MSDGDNPDRPEISESELRLRVAYSLLRPVARLARRYVIPLETLTDFFELACYHELKRAEHTLAEAADHLGVSRRKVAQLSKRLKTNFLAPEQEYGLPRRIEYMLWAGPMTEGRIHQSMPDRDDEAIDDALDELVAQERVEITRESPTVEYAVPDSEFRLYENNWMARIDGLNNLLENLTDAIVGRFFEEDDRAFARTLNFRIREEDKEELERLYEEEIFERLAELEQQVDDPDAEDVVEMSLSALWAPTDLAIPDDDTESTDGTSS